MYRLSSFSAALILAACGDDQGIPGAGVLGAGGRADKSSAPSSAHCVIEVTAGPYSWARGLRDIERVYLPAVLYCEVLGVGTDLPRVQRLEVLKAQAIAARTFLYNKIAERGYVRNSVADQVYKAEHCTGTPPDIFHEAVELTSRTVLTQSPHTTELVAGFYRAGYSSCERPGEAYGEPVMGQLNAATCAAIGWGHDRILRYFYADNGTEPSLMQVGGECDPAPFNYADCTIGSSSGSCWDSSYVSCATGFETGQCPGPSEVQCCLD
jgi:hypothetical protein